MNDAAYAPLRETLNNTLETAEEVEKKLYEVLGRLRGLPTPHASLGSAAPPQGRPDHHEAAAASVRDAISRLHDLVGELASRL